jgi:hypothetical protein
MDSKTWNHQPLLYLNIMKDTINESFVNKGFSASMTFLETRTVPVPPARVRSEHGKRRGLHLPVGLLCPPEDDDELDEGGGKNVDCHDIVEEDEKPKGGVPTVKKN